jgi:hypothetical protein
MAENVNDFNMGKGGPSRAMAATSSSGAIS